VRSVLKVEKGVRELVLVESDERFGNHLRTVVFALSGALLVGVLVVLQLSESRGFLKALKAVDKLEGSGAQSLGDPDGLYPLLEHLLGFSDAVLLHDLTVASAEEERALGAFEPLLDGPLLLSVLEVLLEHLVFDLERLQVACHLNPLGGHLSLSALADDALGLLHFAFLHHSELLLLGLLRLLELLLFGLHLLSGSSEVEGTPLAESHSQL